jgi:hypothetical protein
MVKKSRRVLYHRAKATVLMRTLSRAARRRRRPEPLALFRLFSGSFDFHKRTIHELREWTLNDNLSEPGRGYQWITIHRQLAMKQSLVLPADAK